MISPISQDQWTQLQGVVARAAGHSAFWKRRIGGVAEAVRSPEDFFAHIPFTLKGELQEDQRMHPPFGSNQTAPAGEYTRFCQTSGTMGTPLAVWDTARSWDWLLENWRQGYALAGVRPGDVVFFAFSFGPFLGFWTAFEAAAGMGLRCVPGGGLGSRARLAMLLEQGAQVLCCTPTYALHLAALAKREGIDCSRSAVRKIIVAGEPGGSLPSVRAQLQDAWRGAEVIDHYGLTEVGPVAFEKSGEPGALRILGERYLAEVLVPRTSVPVREGEAGELVLTPLGRSEWPVFRYRTGDLVRPKIVEGQMLLEGGVLGRTDAMLVVRGVNLYPSALEEIVRRFPEVDEYRVVVNGSGPMVQVSVEVEDTAGEGIEGRLESAFEAAFSLRIPVKRIGAGVLPRFEMKAQRWVRV